MGSKKRDNTDSSSYTIMVFKGSGKVKGLRISSRVVFWLFLGLIFYFIVSGAIIYEYIENRNTSREYLGELDSLRSETGKMKKELFRARENIKMLEEHVYNLDGKSEKKEKATGTSPEKKPIPVKEPDLVKKPVPAKEPEKQEPQKEDQKEDIEQAKQDEAGEAEEIRVDVRDLNFQRQGEKLNVAFNLINKDKNNNPVRGYVYMLAIFGDPSSQRIQTYPGAKLQGGMPVWYKAGYFFKIARFMPVKGEFKLAQAEDLPSSLKVLVYDQAGTLIFEEEYDVDVTD